MFMYTRIEKKGFVQKNVHCSVTYKQWKRDDQQLPEKGECKTPGNTSPSGLVT